MSAPLLSVVLPVYQGGAYLRQTVESVLAQTGASFELVVGDDGSTDGSRAYLESLRDPRVRFFPAKGRSGLFPHLNRLIARSRGSVVRFLCQDDILAVGALAAEMAFMKSHPEVGMAFAKFNRVDGTGALLEVGALHDLPGVLPSMLAVQQFFYHGCIAGNLSTVLMPASVLKEVGVFDETFKVSGDYELWARIACRYPVGVIHQNTLSIRCHERQLSRAKSSAVPFVLENARVRRALFPHLPQKAWRAARRFEQRRQGVLDFHLALRCALAGRWQDARAIWRAMGSFGSLKAMGNWVWTLNNRRRPEAPWVLP